MQKSSSAEKRGVGKIHKGLGGGKKNRKKKGGIRVGGGEGTSRARETGDPSAGEYGKRCGMGGMGLM